MKKKPLHILQIVGEPAGGIRRHVHSILLGLKDVSGLRQSYVCSALGGDAGYRSDLPALRQLLGHRCFNLKITKKPALSDFLNLLLLAYYIRKEKVSLVHGHGAKGGAYARMLKLLCGVKVIYTPHGGSVHKMFSGFEDFIYTWAERILFWLTDYFVFESEYSAEAYFCKVRKRSENWVVNYNGIPLPELSGVLNEAGNLGYSLGPEKRVTDIGIFGILRPQKGQLYAVEAAAELRRVGLNIRLHFFGDGPDRSALESFAETSGVKDLVVFHGEVLDVIPHMFAMDIILIPSLFESFGYVGIEAFSLGKPVIASSVGGLREIISDGNTGILIPSQDPRAIAKAVSRVVNDRGLAETLEKKAFDSLKAKYTLGVMLENIKKVYLEVFSA